MARDRFGGFAEPAATPLQRHIQNACDPQNYEPNLALDLEIADLINSKKGTAPREAAIAIVTHANHRNPNIALLALALLDICVKNCGYPFHLQISTKEFLNELVRRFPERPPLRYSRVQSKVLELIEEWRQTICQTSKYKDDLGFIRDMHRLLAYKGYMFPEIKREDAAVLNPSDVLRSADEMEEEERAAQSAKLQELIRRGTPHDLQEANRLMKVMAGYDNRHKTDYRAKAAEEVSKIQQKAKLLEEMLQEHKPGEDLNNVAWEELSNALASAQPKIQKMCEEESEDTEAVAKLFEINDSIHRTLERYRLVKNGDLEGASRIPKGTLGISGAGVRQGAGNELSLIDFGSEDLAVGETPKSQQARQNGGSLENDLLGLSLQDGNMSSEPSISLGPASFSSGAYDRHTIYGDTTARGVELGLQGVGEELRMKNTSGANAASASKSELDFLGISGSGMSGQTSQPAPPASSKPESIEIQGSKSQPHIDPFNSLSSLNPRQGSPFQFQQSIQPASSSNIPRSFNNVVNSTLKGPQVPSSLTTHNNGASAEDEWTFSSSLPDSTHEITVTNTDILVTFRVNSGQPDHSILINSGISNNTAQPISNLTFQLAVMKGYTLSLQPQSGRGLQPHQREGITQTIRVNGSQSAGGKPIKVRWKASYWIGGVQKEEQGEVASLMP